MAAEAAEREEKRSRRLPLVGLLSKPCPKLPSCKQPWPDPTPSDTRNWHSNRLLAMSLDACGRLQSWMGEKSKPFELFARPAAAASILNLLSMQLPADASNVCEALSTNKLHLLPPQPALPIEWSEECVRHLSADAMRCVFE